jgi:bisphosphoglycerate-dependent phosphoglycerate mutase
VEDILKWEIPTRVPLVCELDGDLEAGRHLFLNEPPVRTKGLS